MQLIKLSADKSSFHPVNFCNGINIIVGKKSNPSAKNDGNTFNGVGKSLIVHLIHFCFCSNKIDTLEKSLPDWTFSLQFSCDHSTHTISRNTNKQSVIVLDGTEYKLTEARNKLLELTVTDSNLRSNLTFQSLLSKFVRRYRASYIKYDSANASVPDQYSNLLYNGTLLGLNVDLITNKKKLREEQEALKKTEKTFKKDPIFRQYYLGNNDAQMDADYLEIAIEKLETEMRSFKVSNNYHDIEEEANRISFRKKDVENQISILENNISNINTALNMQADLSIDNVVKMYKTASIEIPELLKKSLEEVEDFHKKLVNSRNIRLKEELRQSKSELRSKEQELAKMGAEMDRLLEYLDTHGALEEYTALNKQLVDLKLQLNHIKEYQEMLKTFQSRLTSIKEQLIFESRDTDEYLSYAESLVKSLRQKYSEMTRMFYPKKKSGLLIANNSGDNQLRFDIEARIEDDSSDGVNEVKIFCFDMLLLLQQISNFGFIIHDSRLLANMDPRQRTTLYRIAYDICNENDFQYITSINDDALETIKDIMDEEEYQTIMEKGIILTLNDDSPNSKLLGIQVDIDLEK